MSTENVLQEHTLWSETKGESGVRAICAGIINTQTGEITDTVRIPREKNDLRAKLRDELDPAHGKGVFQLFSFKTTPPPNWELVRAEEALKANGITQCDDLKKLELEFYLERHNSQLEQAEAELSLVQETRNDALSSFTHHPQKTEIVKAAFEGQLSGCISTIDNIKGCISRVKSALAKLNPTA